MGYTHYWYHKQDFTPLEWKRIQQFVQQAIEVSGIPIGDSWGEPNAPEITDRIIMFNGLKDDGHETFAIGRLRRLPRSYELEDDERGDKDLLADGMFDFCKTARKPYDTVVVAILWYLQREFPDHILVSSDGDIDQHDSDEGRPGFELYRKVVDGNQEAFGWA